jgi:hypothetical protein
MKNKIASATRSTKTSWEEAEGWLACLIVWSVGIAMLLAIVSIFLNPAE